jgi:hypothetical protein
MRPATEAGDSQSCLLHYEIGECIVIVETFGDYIILIAYLLGYLSVLDIQLEDGFGIVYREG